MILITGGAGFVGRHLIDALRTKNSNGRIRVLDARAPAEPLPDEVELMCGSIEDPDVVNAAMKGVEVVIHLAAKVQPDSREVDEMRRINVDGTRNLHSAAVRLGCRHFLNFSSAGIYGMGLDATPFRESDPARPDTSYQRTKWEAEELLLRADSQRMIVNVLRPTGIYGSGNHLVLKNYKKVVGQKFSVEFKGGIMMQPLHVSDVVGAVTAILDRPASHGTAFNLGGERQLLLQDLHALVAAELRVPRVRLVVPTLAYPLFACASLVIPSLRRRNPPLHEISRGKVFSYAVNDRLFREHYPNVGVLPLKDGLQEYFGWARSKGLL